MSYTSNQWRKHLLFANVVLLFLTAAAIALFFADYRHASLRSALLIPGSAMLVVNYLMLSCELRRKVRP